MSTKTLALRTAALASLGLVLSGLVVASAVSPAMAATPSVQSLRLPLPDPSATNEQILGVSCGAPGSCVAVGWYQTSTGLHGLIETLAGGQWTATDGPRPLGTSGATTLGGVSCESASACVAWGQYATGPSTSGYMLAVLDGTWKASVATPPSGGVFPSGGYGNDGPITGVGCTGAGACTAIGNYYDSSNRPRGWVDSYSGHAWQGAKAVVVPPDASGQSSGLTSISCGGGLCQTVGSYVSTNGFQSLETTVNPDGSMNSPFAGKLPTGGPQGDGLNGISCSSGGLCAAYGVYWSQGNSSSASDQEAYVSPVGGTGFQPQQPVTPTPVNATVFPAAALSSASCVSGFCALTGSYDDQAGHFHPLLDRFVNGHWVADVAPGSGYPNQVACGSSTFCVAVDTSTSSSPADVLNGATWSTISIPLPGGALSPQLDQQPVACDAVSSCWVLGAYNAGSAAIFADHFSLGGSSPSPGVTPAQVGSWFHTALVPSGAAARIGSLLRARGFMTAFTVSRAGTLKVMWTSTKGVIATAQRVFARSGRYSVKIVLTRTGLSVLKRVSRLPIKTLVTFTVSGHSAVSARGQTVLRR